MFIFGNLLMALAQILDVILSIYMWVVVISALISWVNPDPYNQIVQFLRAVTEPVLRPIRRRIGTGLGIDISPLLVVLAIWFIRRFFVVSLIEIAAKMKG